MSENPSFERTIQLIGKDAFDRLRTAHVAIFGLGGVGGYVCEALARTGIGHLTLIDKDVIDETNLNRQIIATVDTIGRPKVDVMKERLLSIRPDMRIDTFRMFFLPDTADEIELEAFDYVVDAIDTITAKLTLIERCTQKNIPIVSAMGTGNKMDPSLLKIADLADTRICPLARVMRKELKKRGIEHVRVIYSEEAPYREDRSSTKDMPCHKDHASTDSAPTPEKRVKDTPASAIFVPAAAGLMMANEVVRNLL